ncbi:hypothetical protein FQR65_LT15378 [Abscondita terminalis]|nr:hypothetical protein FQR65_LT15378 [Abscondita terminalis]
MAFNLISFAVYTFLIYKTNCELKFEDDTNTGLYKCVNRVIEQVFTDDETLLVLPSANGSYVYPNTISNPRLIFSVLPLKHKLPFKMGIVLHVDATEKIHKRIKSMLDSSLVRFNLNANVKWIIITSNKHIRDYFLELWKETIIYFVVLLYDFNNILFQTFTGDPQAIPNNCGKSLNSINEQNCDLETIIEFPKVLRKYSNCTFTYFTYNQLKSDTQFGYVVSYFLMNLISNYLNSSFIHSRSVGPGHYTVIVFFLRYMLNTPTTPIFYTSKAEWVVPNPKKIPLIEVIKVMFDKTVWIVILCSFFIIAIVWQIIVKYNNGQSDFTLLLLRVWEATIYGSVNSALVFWNIRFLIICYIVYCVHIQAVFNSKIVEILTTPQYERGIRTVEELSESNIRIFVNNSTKRYLFHPEDLNDNPRLQKIYKLLHGIEPDEFVEVFFNCIKNGDCVAFISREEEYLNNTFFEIAPTIQDNSVSAALDYVWGFLPRSYIFLTLNKIVYILIENGIVDDFVKNKMDARKFKIDSSHKGEAVALTIDHIYIIFMFWSAAKVTVSSTEVEAVPKAVSGNRNPELQTFLNILEMRIGPKKMKLFKTTTDQWIEPKEDTSLYEFWRNVKNEIISEDSVTPRIARSNAASNGVESS